MGYAENLWLFFILLLGIIIVPGMDMLFVLANSLTGGSNRGLAATGGIMLGGAVHSLNGAIGIGLLMHFVPILFNPLLIAGGAYMAFIGYTLMRSSITVGGEGPAGSRSAWKAFRQGAVTCLINPKAYLFIFAVYPQFLKPDYGPMWIQAVIMGAMTIATQFAVYGGLAITAGRSRDLLVANPRATAIAGRAAGLLLVAVSVFTVWEGLKLA
ncbi:MULTISPECIES: LysE family translocator [unclassified Rhizobium]|jgi:threonine/homoserine/homoserine lactone efflux protein|uniref:LysE family translocator n=1 Tax=unclassified Rhizobium TaxID=2613769 RepID=UPI000DE1A559|nr:MULTISPECIES: LysE family translocator [unclassified Rhizobium]MBB3288034.1 threonine/homoserine/homoserine lactone efflux protein [Rhizobium sp. BK252]MBB3403103.1 threonine/homoserine/homoserine lactone efflux protein [Rhizobium sp. BK289]MBB3415680.1 threonine/homoserine/homoserine lactone efflux protein [Rhizobium sp. BK284]MBB3483240.1 threonine/homoserine/homoserine lactone efflux protein [Rhizobium sp. BK347]